MRSLDYDPTNKDHVKNVDHRSLTRSEEGRRVIAFDRQTEDGRYYYADVEMIGDPDMFALYLVKAVDGNDNAVDVNINGHWARLAVESEPLTVRKYVH